MHAMVLRDNAPIGSAPLRHEHWPDPSPGPGEVRVRLTCCAICRTDLHVIEGDLPPARRPIIPGHQAVGVVDQLGPGCTRLQIHQRVGIAWLRGVCGVCRFCSTGRENLCESARFTGYHDHGGYAQYALVDEAFAYLIPPAFTDAHAAPLLCAGIIGYRALHRARPRPGGTLALYGFGSSAHVVLQLARSRGHEVHVVTRGQEHRQLARRMGAASVGASADELPLRVDSAILFAPAGPLVPEALEHLDRGGALALAGIHMSDIPTMNYQRHLFFERDVHSVTCNTRTDGVELLAEAARIPIHPHITEYPLDQANRALQDLKADRINGTAVLRI